MDLAQESATFANKNRCVCVCVFLGGALLVPLDFSQRG